MCSKCILPTNVNHMHVHMQNTHNPTSQKNSSSRKKTNFEKNEINLCLQSFWATLLRFFACLWLITECTHIVKLGYHEKRALAHWRRQPCKLATTQAIAINQSMTDSFDSNEYDSYANTILQVFVHSYA